MRDVQNYKQVKMLDCCMMCIFSKDMSGLRMTTSKGAINCTRVDNTPGSFHAHVIYDDVKWNYVCDDYKSDQVLMAPHTHGPWPNTTTTEEATSP